MSTAPIDLSNLPDGSIREFFDPGRWISVGSGRLEELHDFPVTNAVLEFFAPSHFGKRNRFSNHDDHPAVHVSVELMEDFCSWLSMLDRSHEYDLPSESSWVAAFGSGRNFKLEDKDKAIHFFDRWGRLDDAGGASQARTRTEAIEAWRHSQHRHPSWRSEESPGLLDMVGNVPELCCGYASDQAFVVKGFVELEWTEVWSSSHLRKPVSRMSVSSGVIGFRVCRRPKSLVDNPTAQSSMENRFND
ncbi:MAG: SUMF1/EgtB/PvdO family nonheme iron enzyme [Planctomycetota bacterium]